MRKREQREAMQGYKMEPIIEMFLGQTPPHIPSDVSVDLSVLLFPNP